jgi:lysophospholipase L1-like esterase
VRAARRVCVALTLLVAAAGCGDDGSSAASTSASTSEATRPTSAEPLRLLPVGDSITAGPYYRAPLQRLLAADGCRVDFVGSMVDENPDQDGLSDLDNEGHGGWRADQLAESATAWAAAAEPDVILLYAGVNDFYAGEDVTTVSADLARLVEGLQAGAPGAELLVAQIMPAAGIEDQVAEYDDAVAALDGERISVVDLHSGFDPAEDTEDGVHPNAAASERIAEAWYEALQPHLDEVCAG